MATFFATGWIRALSRDTVFDKYVATELRDRTLREPPKTLVEHDLNVPGELDGLLQRCLAKEPADRPTSAFEIAEALASIPRLDSWDNGCAKAWWNEHSDITLNAPAETESASETVI